MRSRAGQWTAELIAERLHRLCEEHGVPNRFQLHEVVGSSERAVVMTVSRIARLQWWRLNAALAKHGVEASYQCRQGPMSPAYLIVAPATKQADKGAS